MIRNLLIASVAALGFSIASNAQASLMLDLRAEGSDSKHITLATGGTVTIDVYAVLTGSDTIGTNDYLQFWSSSFASTSGHGTFSVASATAPFNGTFVAGTPAAGILSSVTGRSLSATQGTNNDSNGVSEYELATFTFTPADATTLTAQPLETSAGALWWEDGTATTTYKKTPVTTGASYFAGTPVTVSLAVPEPTTLGLLGLSALGLLLPRRRQA